MADQLFSYMLLHPRFLNPVGQQFCLTNLQALQVFAPDLFFTPPAKIILRVWCVLQAPPGLGIKQAPHIFIINDQSKKPLYQITIVCLENFDLSIEG